MAYPTISTLPTPPSRQDPANFSNDADAFLGALPTFQSEVNAAGSYIETKASEVATDASEAAASASQAAASAIAAALEAAQWVSGGSYTEGEVVWTDSDYSTYRAKTTHSGVSTDPSADTTNWQNISGFTSLSDFGVTFTVDANGVTSFTDGLNEGFAAVTSNAGATTVNCRDGNVFSHTLTENTTFTFSNPPATGTAYGFTLKLVQDATARTVTWPASVDWAGATAPTISTGSGEVDVFVFFTHDGGTTWYGFTAGQVMS